MKGRIDMFCASQASTAICMSMEQGSSSSTIYLGSSRAIDRHNPIIKDARRATKTLTTAPCSSHQTPINPKPHKHHHKNRKSSSKPSDDASKKPVKQNDQKKKNCAEENDSFRRSFAKPSHLLTPPSSSRYLLGDTAFFKSFSDYDPVLALVPVESKKVQGVTTEETCYSLPASSSGSSGSSDQVVVLRVSLHCKGCAGKVRKHISRMEGVTSFNIDFAAKKVTVIGDVTPLGVLASISKVKNAQLLTPAMSSQQPS